MRHVPVQFDVFSAARNAEAARAAEWRALHRRPDAPPLPAEPEAPSRRSFAWLPSLPLRLMRRGSASGAR